MDRDGRPTNEEIRGRCADDGRVEYKGATYAFTGLESGSPRRRTRSRC